MCPPVPTTLLVTCASLVSSSELGTSGAVAHRSAGLGGVADHYLYLARHGEALDEGELSETGRRQAKLLGRRMRETPLDAVWHSPLPRAARTAALLGLPGVPVTAVEELGDYPPPLGGELPPVYAEFARQFSADDRAEGARLAGAAIARFAVPAPEDRHDLLVTHNFLAAWFVCHALDAPAGGWA